MKNFIKSLNWSGALITFLICGLGAMSRSNESIEKSLLVWLIIGVPISLIFLFIGRVNEK